MAVPTRMPILPGIPQTSVQRAQDLHALLPPWRSCPVGPATPTELLGRQDHVVPPDVLAPAVTEFLAG